MKVRTHFFLSKLLVLKSSEITLLLGKCRTKSGSVISQSFNLQSFLKN